MKLDNPLLEYLGIRLLEWEPGRCVFDLEIEPRHLNRQASLQGGVTATLLDAACGYAGLQSTADAPPDNAVTVMLTISYVSKVQQGRIKAIGRVTGSGRRMYFAAAELYAEDGRLVATAQGTFKRSSSAASARQDKETSNVT